MKKINEKKQELLLDALSCIDDDILERGLALRDGVQPAADGVKPTDKPSKAADMAPYLFDLSELNRKPPKKSPWRVISVVAAACLLLCVIPLSVWMVGRMTSDAPTYDETLHDSMQNSQAGIQDGNGMDTVPEESPDGPLHEPEQEEPNAPTDTEPPREEATESPADDTEGVTESETTPVADVGGDMAWTVEENYRDGFSYVGAYGSSQIFLNGTVETDSNEIYVSSTDELALKLIGQWYFSVYSLNYDLHFSLFPDEAIAERILPSFEKAGKTYKEGVAKITHTAEEIFFVQGVNLTLTLLANEQLEGTELIAYQRQFEMFHPGSMEGDSITYVRRIQLAEEVRVDLNGRFRTTNEYTEFYFYEYNGCWYLDARERLDDDLSIDLFEADPATSPYYKTHTVTGVLTDWDEEYLYLEGTAIMIHDVKLPHDLEVGKTVTVTYHGLTVEFFRIEFDQTATESVIIAMGDSVTMTAP